MLEVQALWTKAISMVNSFPIYVVPTYSCLSYCTAYYFVCCYKLRLFVYLFFYMQLLFYRPLFVRSSERVERISPLLRLAAGAFAIGERALCQ